MTRGGGNLARTAYSLVRGLNRGPLSKMPFGVPNITGSYEDGFKGTFVKTFPEETLTVEQRLPEHYLHFYHQWKKGPTLPIHQRHKAGIFEKDHVGRVVPVQNAKIPVLYPQEFHQGLWGGEGVIKGLLEPEVKKHKPNYDEALERYWMPNLFIGVVYSEVLDAHMKVTMTKRAQRLIDQSYGLDSYLLKTPVNEVYSLLGLKIKREILLKLAGQDRSERLEKIRSKYQDYVVPYEVADWHGLPWLEAVDKLVEIERLEDEENIRPLKEEYRKELLDLLAKGQMDDVDPSVLYDEGHSNLQFTDAIKNTFKNITKGKEKK